MITSLFADWMRDSNKEMTGGGVTQGQAGELAEGGLTAAAGATGRNGQQGDGSRGNGSEGASGRTAHGQGAVAGLLS